MFTTITNRHKKNLSNELNFLGERIEIDGLKPEYDVRLAAYYIDALKFKQGIEKLKRNKTGFPENKVFSKTHDHGIFLHIIYDLIHDYNKVPNNEKLKTIAKYLTIAEQQNLYPRLENDVEDKIYTDLLKSKNLMEINSIMRLTKSFHAANQSFIDKLNMVNVVDHFDLESEKDFKNFEEIAEVFSSRRSLLELLKFHPLQDLKLEKFLTNIRRTYLQNYKKIKFNVHHFEILNALAVQSFLNEFICSISDEEKHLLQILEEELASINHENDNSNHFKTMIFASYTELSELKNKSILRSCTDLKNLYSFHIEQKLIEQDLKQKIPSFLKLKDKTSGAVQSQYEENPYPRWESIHIPEKKRMLGDWLCSYSRRFQNSEITKIKYPKILVAGTGTGQQSIGSAVTFSGGNVDAIDLSKSSLSYALRKSKDLRVKNINFFQADLFEIDFLEKKYDLIQCSGVLHHTSNPLAGLKSIKSKLSSHGVIQLGLYSRLARFDLNKVRNYIAENAIGSSKDEMLDFRRELINNPRFKTQTQALARWGDFFTTSMFRDLCFHEHEVQYDCQDLQKLIDEAGLEFVGMMLSQKQKKQFHKITGQTAEDADLNDWYEFELNNTYFFAEMYNFFVRPLS